MAPTVYANNFVKKEINTTLCTMYQHRKIQKRKQRVLPVSHLELAQHVRRSLRFAVRYSIFRTYILSKTGMIKLLEKSGNYSSNRSGQFLPK